MDQQCRRACAVLLPHPAHPENASPPVDLLKSARSWYRPRIKFGRHGLTHRKSSESNRYFIHVRTPVLGTVVRHCATSGIRLHCPDLDPSHLDVRMGQVNNYQSGQADQGEIHHHPMVRLRSRDRNCPFALHRASN